MQEKTFLQAVSAIFSIIAVLHASRIALGWYAEIGGWSVPLWFSWVGVVFAGYLAYTGFTLSKK